MALPTAPTALSIVQEACSKANHANAVGRARDQWMEEIKADIWRNERKFRPLMTVGIQTVTAGKSTYTMPPDYAQMIQTQLLTGTATGTGSAFSSNSITFPAGTVYDSSIVGREIFITTGTGNAQDAYASILSLSGQVATLTDWQFEPTAGDTYMIAETSYMLDEKSYYTYDEGVPYTLGRPREIYPVGDPDFGELVLHPVPDGNYPYVLKMKYFANLLRLDLTSTMLSTLYQRWRNVWVAGIYAKALQDKGDRGYGRAFAEYRGQIQELINHEKYGDNINHLGGQVIDYE